MTLNLDALFAAGEIKVHPKEDVAVIRIGIKTSTKPEEKGTFTMQMVPGVKVEETAPHGIRGAELKIIKKFEEVLVGNEVYIFGYPTSLGLKEIPQLDPLYPLLRRGIIAGRNFSTKSLVIDGAVYPGNSGGPVLEVSHQVFQTEFRMIGVIREFVPYKTTVLNSGYAIATPMDFVLELIDK